MKSTEYIEWDKLEQIPFCLCRIAEDEENQEIDVYYLDKRVCHDYDHVRLSSGLILSFFVPYFRLILSAFMFVG